MFRESGPDIFTVQEFNNRSYRAKMFPKNLNDNRLSENELVELLKSSVYSIESNEIERIVEKAYREKNIYNIGKGSPLEVLGIVSTKPFPNMKIPLSSKDYDLEFLLTDGLSTYSKAKRVPDFIAYETKLIGYCLRRITKVSENNWENIKILYQPSSEIRAALMTSSKEDILNKLFSGDLELMARFEKAFNEKSGRRVILNEVVFNKNSHWEGEKHVFVGHAGSIKVPSLSGKEVPNYKVRLKTPVQKIDFDDLMLYDSNCTCGTQENTANGEGGILRINCHHISAAENFVTKGLKSLGKVKLTDNFNNEIDNFPIAKVLEPLTNLDHPLVRKFVEMYYFKDKPLWQVNLNLVQFPEQILHPTILEKMIDNYHLGQSRKVLGKMFRLTGKGWDSLVKEGVPVAHKGGYTFMPYFVTSFPKYKNYPKKSNT